MRLKLVLFGLLFSFSSIAQSLEDLLANPEVTWVGETEFIYFFENGESSSFYYSHAYNSSRPDSGETQGFKFAPPLAYNYGTEQFLSYLLHNLIVDERTTIWDASKTKKLREQEILRVFNQMDTIKSIDPETFQESVQIVRNCGDIFSGRYKVHQIWFYNTINNQLQSRIAGITPLRLNNDNTLSPLLYIEFSIRQDVPKYTINTPEIVWMKQTKSTYDFRKIRSLKGNHKTTFQQIFKANVVAQKQPIYKFHTQPFLAHPEVFQPQEIPFLFDSISLDTISFYNSNTFELSYRIEQKPPADFDALTDYSLVQNWYFNYETKQLHSELLTIGPIVEHFDEKGQFKYAIPLYWIRM